jgi:hypothetical protein
VNVAIVAQAANLTVREHTLNRERGYVRGELGGLFTVAKDFTALGSEFKAGQLVDRSILPDGLLFRHAAGRAIRQVEGAMAGV